jgi:hypothetical protein
MAASLKIVFTGKKGDAFTPLTGKIMLAGNCEIGANDERFLSVGCVSARELKAEVDSLKRQLDEIVRTAKSKFSQDRQPN